MPANLQSASASAVFPNLSYTAFNEKRIFPILSQIQHDGTTISSIIVDGVNSPVSIRTWTVSVRLNSTDLGTLRTFYQSQNGGAGRWYFYDPYFSSAIQTSYDATGVSTDGRYTCIFLTQAWSETTGISSIGNVASLSFMQVA